MIVLAVVMILAALLGSASAQERMNTQTVVLRAGSSVPHPVPLAIDAAIQSRTVFARTIRIRGDETYDVIVRRRNLQPGRHKWEWREGRCEYWGEEGWLVSAGWSKWICQSVLAGLASTTRGALPSGTWVRLRAARFLFEGFEASCHLGYLNDGGGVGWWGLRIPGMNDERLTLGDCTAVYDALTVVR